MYDGTRFYETSVAKGNSTRSFDFDAILTVVKFFNDNSLFVPFFVVALNQDISANFEFTQCPCVCVVSLCYDLVSLCELSFTLLSRQYPVLVQVKVSWVRWDTILEISVKEDLRWAEFDVLEGCVEVLEDC